MKIISTKIHGILDYSVALFLIAMPWIFDFNDGGKQTLAVVGSGLVTIFYSLTTRYELSIAEVIPFSSHLLLDTISGVFLIASPWLLGFHESVYAPHVVIGLLELFVVLLTKDSTPSLNQKRRAAVR